MAFSARRNRCQNAARRVALPPPPLLLLLLLLFPLVLLLRPASAATSCWDTFSKANFTHCQQLDPTYALHWRIANGTITFGVAVNPAPTWLGLGLSEAGGMKGADLLVLTPTGNASAPYNLTDYFSTAYQRPNPDAQQDALLLSTALANNTLSATFLRPLATCDTSDWPIALNNTVQHVVWAYGTTPSFSYHGPNTRGNAMVTFDPDPTAAPPADPADTTTLSVTMPKYTPPSNVTTDYRCVVAKLPTGPKRHMFRFESQVNSSLLHHMILYGCSKPPPYDVGVTFDCANMPQNCNTFLVVWAPGQSDFEFPEEAAMAVGGDGIGYFALQAHYNNPKQLAAPPDTSGFTLYFTNTLRKYDAAVLWLGSEQVSIPPRAANYSTIPSFCASACTKQFTSNMTVIHTFPHMHLTGQSIVTRQIRDGRELPPLTIRRYWDFNFQQNFHPPAGTKIMAGDVLITTCTYDTSDRDKPTEWGESSNDEMCYNFVFYYPAQPTIEECVSFQVPQGEFGTCATREALTLDNPTAAEMRKLYADGKLVLFSSNQTFANLTAYAPVCAVSADMAAVREAAGGAAAAAGGSPATSGGSPAPKGSGAQAKAVGAGFLPWVVMLLASVLLAAPVAPAAAGVR